MFGTGISILYIDALRTLGIPARLVGTPAWNGNVTNGNHNWVEVWIGSDDSAGWKFIEGLPAGGPTETFENPCDKWFCNNAHFSGFNSTKVFAARFSQSRINYPMAWDLENVDIPGGILRSEVGDVSLQATSKVLTGPEIAELPLLRSNGEVVLKVGDIATVRDGFADVDSIDQV